MPFNPTNPVAEPSGSALAPLREPIFRLLWTAWMVANLCMWMNDVAAAWLMTTLEVSPLMVALVQTASAAPVFLLGLPSGAFADILDRRTYFLATQAWVAVNAIVIFLVLAADLMTPVLLLVLTFANGIALAMRWPVYSAIVPELVPREQLPAALGLNGIAMNVSRIVGPLIAGAVIASAGTPYVFALNAALSVVAAFAIWRWRRESRVSALPGERFIGAMRIGLQFVAQSPQMKSVLLRIFVFFLSASALMALLPLQAMRLGGGALTYTVMISSIGVGAIAAVLLLPRIRGRWTRDHFVFIGTIVLSLAMAGVAFAPWLWLASPLALIGGAAWIAAANAMSVSAQYSLPDWVRARGMSIYQVALMGGSAGGAAIWGQVATVTDASTSLTLAALAGTVTLWLTRRVHVHVASDEDFSIVPPENTPGFGEAIPLGDGPVMVLIEYRIDPARADEFREVMEETRRLRLRQGALSWELFRDTNDPAVYYEHLVDASWAEHLRRFERMTVADHELRDRRRAFHVGGGKPKVTRCVADEVRAGSSRPAGANP